MGIVGAYSMPPLNKKIMKKFNYIILNNIDEDDLKEMGKMGWELICVVRNELDYMVEFIYYFKKEL